MDYNTERKLKKHNAKRRKLEKLKEDEWRFYEKEEVDYGETTEAQDRDFE